MAQAFDYTPIEGARSAFPLVISDPDTLSLLERSQELHRHLGFNQEILAGYLNATSQRIYCRDFYAYLTFAGSREAALRPETLARWIQSLAAEDALTPYAPATINRMISAVKRLMREAGNQGYIDLALADAFQRIRSVRELALKERQRSDRRVEIRPEAMRTIIEQPDRDRLIGLRDRAILLTLSSSGLRVETFRLLTHDQLVINSHSQTYQLRVRSKNDKDFGLVPLSKEAYIAIVAWLAARPIPSPYLFTHFEGGEGDGPNARLSASPLSARSVRRIVQKHADDVVGAHVKPHDFRRFLGTSLAKKSIHQAQLALRHKDARTTLNHYVIDQLEEGISDSLF